MFVLPSARQHPGDLYGGVASLDAGLPALASSECPGLFVGRAYQRRAALVLAYGDDARGFFGRLDHQSLRSGCPLRRCVAVQHYRPFAVAFLRPVLVAQCAVLEDYESQQGKKSGADQVA